MHIPWDWQFYQRSALFNTLQPLCEQIVLPHTWPSLTDYNQWLQQLTAIPQTQSGHDLRFVPQSSSTESLNMPYEMQIYMTGNVPTRLENWHDFFNAMMWFIFPHIKAQLNAHQYQALQRRWPHDKFRTMIENKLALFDENGVVVISDRPELLELIKSFQWHELFWQRRMEVMQHMRFYIIGHSLYEKALQPYIGMTGHAILSLADTAFFSQSLHEQLSQLDHRMALYLADAREVSNNDILSPLPILGIPGWYPANESEVFYFNQAYFRTGRIRNKHASTD